MNGGMSQPCRRPGERPGTWHVRHLSAGIESNDIGPPCTSGPLSAPRGHYLAVEFCVTEMPPAVAP